AEKKVRNKLFIVRGSSWNLAESAGIAVAAGLRVEIVDLGVDCLVFPAGFQAVSSEDQRIVQLWIDDGRILELRIAPLHTHLRVAADGLAVEASGESFIRGIIRQIEL